MTHDLEADLAPLLDTLAEALLARGWQLATAESCTGGLIAACCTSRPGSSRWFERGVVSYSNAAKTALLDVPPELIERCGAVSAEVACAMAAGLLARSPAGVAVAVTGIAGPDGGTPLKPVGTVWLAVVRCGVAPDARLLTLGGDRRCVRHATVQEALRQVLQCIQVEAVPISFNAAPHTSQCRETGS